MRTFPVEKLHVALIATGLYSPTALLQASNQPITCLPSYYVRMQLQKHFIDSSQFGIFKKFLFSTFDVNYQGCWTVS